MIVRDARAGSVPVRIYQPTVRARAQGLVWAHGGGFRGGSLDMPEADAVGRALADRGHPVVSVGYRLVDDAVHFPSPSDDVLAAWEWTAAGGAGGGGSDATAWHLGGASAGGNLALGAVLRLRDAGRVLPGSLVLAYPTLHAIQPASSEVDAVEDRIDEPSRWDAERIAEMYARYLGDAPGSAARYAVPGELDPTGLPPTFELASELDDLRRSAEAHATALAAAGVPHRYVVETGAGHGHLNRPEEPWFALSIERIARWLSEGVPDRSSATDVDTVH